ncbi:MFS transporter [Sneathiella marina]|uniref:MFS transporter n=1 Tax=Sneathiella marina TaxID=2950108 RepID=A0ABY4W0G4_9PROT|nr:MFS transporter [Sneathiella marina]USG60573.1 MFS transporter [Sneathiella marina]
MKLTKFALLSVVFLDIMSQGLVIPILNTIIMSPAQDFLPKGTSTAVRQFDFGLTMAVFFIAWFFGAAYISKISDYIGRKAAMLICLVGALLAYILTIIALDTNSLTLLIIARILSGFTAGNQPIAQAALVDLSENEDQKIRFMGLVLLAVSIGMVAGPLISGLMSDPAVFGKFASAALPFYLVAGMVVAGTLLIIFYYRDPPVERPPFTFKPLEIFVTMWHMVDRPLVLRLAPVFFFAQLTLSGFYVFMDTYFFSRFQFDTLQNAFTMVVLGLSMGTVSAFLVGPISARFNRLPILYTSLGLMTLSTGLSILNPSPALAYVLIATFFVPFALYYPTLLTLFSKAVDETEQGWVMGVGVALFTLGAGIISLIGGWLMSIDIHLPFIISVISALIAMGLIALLWRGPEMKKLLERE